MSQLREAVVEALYSNADNDESLIREIDRLAAKTGEKSVYAIFFHVLTYLELDPEAAAACWNEVLYHRSVMAQALGREVNLRTVICDYFCSIDKTLKNPVVVEIHAFEDQLNSLKYDSLTGLYTRANFNENIKREIARAKRYGTELSLLFLDIDDFKKVNDTYGHVAGDLVLKKASETISGQIRIEDMAARYGGEEILVLLPRTSKVAGLILGERVREKVQSMEFPYEQDVVRLTISGGLATFPIDAQDDTGLIRCADTALYRAKEFGKNNIMVYSQDKRRYFRVNFHSPVIIRQLGNIMKKTGTTAYGKNISMAGILFESSEFFDIGTRLEIQIPFNGSISPLLVIGTVVRVEMFDENRYDIGVSFLSIDKSVKNEISRYIIWQLEGPSYSVSGNE